MDVRQILDRPVRPISFSPSGAYGLPGRRLLAQAPWGGHRGLLAAHAETFDSTTVRIPAGISAHERLAFRADALALARFADSGHDLERWLF